MPWWFYKRLENISVVSFKLVGKLTIVGQNLMPPFSLHNDSTLKLKIEGKNVEFFRICGAKIV